MWTHRHPFKKLITTRDSIEYWARAELFRTLNIGRVVGFIGSGVTRPYGRLSWGELARILVIKTAKLYRIRKEDSNYHISDEAKRLHRSLIAASGTYDRTLDRKPYPNKLNLSITDSFEPDTAVLEVCEELADALNCSDFTKRETEKAITASPLLRFENRLLLVQGSNEGSPYDDWRKAIEAYLNKKGEPDFRWDKSEGSTSEAEVEGIDSAVNFFCMHNKSKSIFDKFVSDAEDNEDFVELIKGSDPSSVKVDINLWDWISGSYVANPAENTKKEKFPNILYFFIFLLLMKATTEFKDKEIDPASLLSDPDSGSFRDSLKYLFKNTYRFRDCGHPPETAETIAMIVDGLGIKRLLTLNYDTELERYFRKHWQFDLGEGYFISATRRRDTKNPEEAVRARDGIGGRLHSVTLNEGNVGRLVEFSALASHHDPYILHLHGRADAVDDLIVTEHDYQLRYMKTSASRQALDEGLKTLLLGNDILFLGIGMNEADLFKPMRQFMAEGQRFRSHQDGVIALLAEEQDSGEDARDRHSKTERRTLKLKVEYGIKTRVYPRKNDSGNSTTSTNTEADEVSQESEAEIGEKEKLLQIKINALKKMSSIQDKQYNLTEQFVTELKNIAKKQAEWWIDWQKLPETRSAIYRKLPESSEKPESSGKRGKVWARQQLDHPSDGEGQKHPDLLDALSEIEFETESQDNSIWSNFFSNKPSTVGLRIARISGIKGIGKGSVVKNLQQNFEQFFPKIGNQDLQYAGAFFADARYTTEFNSVIVALMEFVYLLVLNSDSTNGRLQSKEGRDEVRRLLKDHFNNTCDQHVYKAPNGDIKLLEHLFWLFSDLSKTADHLKNRRLFICLSSLDRLVDNKGDGFNTLHRKFFRVITGYDAKTLGDSNRLVVDAPIDLVLIADSVKPPIRYLSKIADQKPSKSSRQTLKNSHYRMPLALWSKLKHTEVEQRSWLPLEEHDPYRENSDKESFVWERPEGIKDLCSQNVAFHLWIRALNKSIKEFLKKASENPTKPIHTKPENSDQISRIDDEFKDFVKNYIKKMDKAASWGGIKEAIAVLLDIYFRMTAITSEKEEISKLRELVMRRIALFSIPIERCVLAACPKIRDEVKQLKSGGDENKKNEISERDVSEYLQDNVLNDLVSQCLVMRIRGGVFAPDNKSGRKDGHNDQPKHEGSTPHYRYTLHSTMREYLAKRMRYVSFDHGEHSFFDISLYATQPRDLPSPTDEDYKEIGLFVSALINTARDALAPLYRYMSVVEKKRDPKQNEEEKKENQKKLVKALCDSETEWTKLDSIHSNAMRLRACANLLNGAFSIGVISRLFDSKADYDFGGEAPEPYENYRNWSEV